VTSDIQQNTIQVLTHTVSFLSQPASVGSYCLFCSWLADSFHPDDWATCSSETSVLTRVTGWHIPDDGILHIQKKYLSINIFRSWSILVTSNWRTRITGDRMASSWMLRRVALVRTDVSEELNASFFRVTRIGEIGTTPAVTSNRRSPRSNTKGILSRETGRSISWET
jgi:hypothetical protein